MVFNNLKLLTMNFCFRCSLLLVAILTTQTTVAQTTQWGVPTGNVAFPMGEYNELPDPEPKNAKAWETVTKSQISWASSDVRYAKGAVPNVKTSTTNTLYGWRGERVSAQALVWSGKELKNLTVSVSGLKGPKGSPEIKANASFVRYVMQDNFPTCGFRTASADYDSVLVADPIDHLTKTITLEPQTTRPIWVSVDVPAGAKGGLYKGVMTIKDGASVIGELSLNIEVSNREMPKVADWKFHLDLWQNPFAEARYARLEPFSTEFFNYVRPQFERLASAGQKVITTSIIHKPWGGQTEDYFESMIKWTKKRDGNWSFDYTNFDKWVEFMMSVGIDKQIACYSMIPWKMEFQYFDEATDSLKYINTTTSTQEYSEVWTSLLTSLSKHLRQKGWFSKTVIAMDERPSEDMQNAFRIIKAADPEFKVSMAGNYHPELQADLYDYSIASDFDFSPEVMAERKASGKISTYYTCCAQQYPSTFTYSPPAESEWISWYSAAKGLDGYLRWAYNSYTKEPLLDARFRAFQSGDTYVVYPEARTSIRFEKFRDGVEMFEKIRLLKDEFKQLGDTKSLAIIDETLAGFSIENFKNGIKPEDTLVKAREVINSL